MTQRSIITDRDTAKTGHDKKFAVKFLLRIFAVPQMVDVVQLVEHRIVVPSVVGSSPIIHPTEKRSDFVAPFFVSLFIIATFVQS